MQLVSVDSGHLTRTAASLRDAAEGVRDSGDRFASGLQATGFGQLLESDAAAAEALEIVHAVVGGMRDQVEELHARADALEAQARAYRSAEDESARIAGRPGRA
ncbi:hypothetical protein ACL03H_15745 [Saccharopolyspora sp. MS10]|uniref:hypothetical protein n=1 Tax=Saccharopolyspora sp. MS10 TaxID=3385973 RepID=UPI0039A18A91